MVYCQNFGQQCSLVDQIPPMYLLSKKNFPGLTRHKSNKRPLGSLDKLALLKRLYILDNMIILINLVINFENLEFSTENFLNTVSSIASHSYIA